MGLVRGIKSMYKKNEAAIVVQELLEHQVKVRACDLDPASLADKLVADVWDQDPRVFNGLSGQRPHKITVAALALANGLDLFEEDPSNWYALALSLGNVLSEIEVNSRLYPLNSLDHQLLETAAFTFAHIAGEFSDMGIPKDEPNIQSYETFEDWYAAYKRAAGDANSRLKEDENGNSLLDFMEHEPLKRAFRDGVEPESLARDFAKQFNVKTFGRR